MIAPSTTIHAKVGKTAFEVYADKYRRKDWWWVRWEDHARRIIVRRVEAVSKVDEDEAVALAKEVIKDYQSKHREALQQKWDMKIPDLWELAQTASFPREIVAAVLTDLRERIVRAESIEDRGVGHQGLQILAERTGISPRELHRIIEDRTRIKVGFPTVDRLCVEFDMLVDDFIEEALAWSGKYGRWADRPGEEDSWPIGYTTDAKEDEPIL